MVVEYIEQKPCIPKDGVWCHGILVVQAAQARGDRGEYVAIAIHSLKDKARGTALGVAGCLLDYGFDVGHDVLLRNSLLRAGISRPGLYGDSTP